MTDVAIVEIKLRKDWAADIKGDVATTNILNNLGWALNDFIDRYKYDNLPGGEMQDLAKCLNIKGSHWSVDTHTVVSR